jgi:thiamine-phosphate pyrophosphorylase
MRILDASLNRAAEGLRVVEDYVRFALDDVHLTRLLKELRHDLAAIAGRIPLWERHAARDTPHDVGTAVTTAAEERRPDTWAVCAASFERVKQSLRSLEEFGKVSLPQEAAQFEQLRYRLYAIESAVGQTVDAAERLADVRLCVLIDGGKAEQEFVSLVEQLVAAGLHAIQLRAKPLNDRELIKRARALVEISRGSANSATSPDQARSGLASRSAPLVIINDRPDVAAAVNADGVHVGQDDMTVKDARGVIGPRKLVGVSTHSIEQARAAVLAGANYIGVGPTFPSPTKQFDAFPGVALLRQVAAEIRLPAFAIGGVSSKNLGEVRAAGLDRVAVSSAVTQASSPREAAAKLLSALRG